jgi:hypothetical protein
MTFVANQLLLQGIVSVDASNGADNPSLVVNLGNKRPRDIPDALVAAISYALKDWSKDMSFELVSDVPYGIKSFAEQINGRRIMLARDDNEFVAPAPHSDLIADKNCLLIDEVITDGVDTLKAIRALEKSGAKVVDVLAVFDCQQGGVEMLKGEGFKPSALYGADDFLHFCASMGIVCDMSQEETRAHIPWFSI